MELSELRLRYPDCETFKFGDSRELCDELTSLVIQGKKSATCEALSAFESGSEAMPGVGRIDVALNWDGRPAVAIRTVSVEIKRYCDVDEDFALAEGENDSLDGWRADHRAYFERCGNFDPGMKLVCERFEVVEVFQS